MRVLRTPEARFEGLEGYDFAPHYTEVEDEDGTLLRIHHVDEGPRIAAPILLMHGLSKWLTALDLSGATLVCRDWGGTAGLHRRVWERIGRFHQPFLTLFGAEDPVTRGGEKRLQEHVPGAAGRPHPVFPDASHFLQEDVPDQLVERILAFVGNGP